MPFGTSSLDIRGGFSGSLSGYICSGTLLYSLGEVDMAGKAKSQTLEQKIEQGIARRQFAFDPIDSVDQHVHCQWCGGSLLIDYFTFGTTEMTRKLTSWVREHSTCEPQWKTKPKDMVLTPKEHSS